MVIHITDYLKRRDMRVPRSGLHRQRAAVLDGHAQRVRRVVRAAMVACSHVSAIHAIAPQQLELPRGMSIDILLAEATLI